MYSYNRFSPQHYTSGTNLQGQTPSSPVTTLCTRTILSQLCHCSPTAGSKSITHHQEYFYVGLVCLFAGCSMSQQHASVSQGRTYSGKFMCCYTEIKVADQTFNLTQSQNTDTGLTSPSTDPVSPGTWQGSHWSANF